MEEALWGYLTGHKGVAAIEFVERFKEFAELADFNKGALIRIKGVNEFGFGFAFEGN